MRLMIIASWYPTVALPTVGSFIREQALALSRAGHEVHVVYFNSTPRLSLLGVLTEKHEGLIEHGIAVPFPLHRLLGFYVPGILARVLRRIIQRVKPDLVHAHAARPAGVVASLAVRGTGLPLVFTEHKGNIEEYWYTRHGKRQVEKMYKSCSRLYGVSRGFISDLEAVFPSTRNLWRVCHNGIDTDMFHIEPGKRSPFSNPDVRVLFLGGTPRNKGLRILLDALALLPSRYLATAAGPGTEPASADALIPPALRTRVELLGRVSREQVVHLMNSHDVLVVPSFYETFSLVCAEALACGTPVAASRCRGPEEILGGGYGELFEAGNAQALAGTLLKMESDADAWSPEAARRYVLEHYSMEKLAQFLTRNYGELTTAPPRLSGHVSGQTSP